MANGTGVNYNTLAYGVNQPYENIFQEPIVATRAPTVNDLARIGTLWIQPVNTANAPINSAWILTSIIGNMANWLLVEAGGGAGVFSSLTVTPGPISLTGTTTINTVGNAVTTIGNNAGTSTTNLYAGTGGLVINGAASTAITVGSSLATGTITVGGVSQTGTLTFGQSTAGQAINVGAAAGPNIVTLGSTTGAAQTLLQGGSAGINLSTGIGAANNGLITAYPAYFTVASPAATIATTGNIGQILCTGFSTAAAASQAFTINNATIATGSTILCSASNTGTNNALMSVVGVVLSAGSAVITVYNNGAQALNGNITIAYWILD